MMQTAVLVDILMGTFNGSRYVVDQIKSLQAQTHENWHLYIRDDASTDATVSLVADMALKDSRIYIIRDDLGNLGFNLNFHKLLSHAKSAYIMFCDQDDIWEPAKISKTVCCLIRNEETNCELPLLIHCESCIVDSSLSVVSKNFVGTRARLTGLLSVLFANPAQGATIMINRILCDLMLLNAPLLPYDYKAALVAEATGFRHFLAEPLLLYRQHDSNVIGAIGTNTTSSPSKQWNYSATLQMGIDASAAVEITLKQVKEHWHPSTERLLDHHMNFVQHGFSPSKLFWITTNKYGFYRRMDLLYSILHAVGLTKR